MGSNTPEPFYGTTEIQKQLSGMGHRIAEMGAALGNIKGDVKWAKYAATGAVATAQLIKIDVSAWKIDEKGISFFGLEKLSWPWINKDKNAKKDTEKANTEKREKELRQFVADRYYAKSDLPTLKADVANADNTASEAKSGVADLKKKLQSIGRATEPRTPGGRESATKQVTALRQSVTDLSTSLAGL